MELGGNKEIVLIQQACLPEKKYYFHGGQGREAPAPFANTMRGLACFLNTSSLYGMIACKASEEVNSEGGGGGAACPVCKQMLA